MYCFNFCLALKILFTEQASFLEIYNEEIRDLLATEKNLKYDIKMCDSKGSDIYVTNLKVRIFLCRKKYVVCLFLAYCIKTFPF
jgi:hypothetical protein